MTIAAAAAVLAACSPALDWRELAVGDTGLKAAFPCKPEKETRQVALAGRTVAMDALVCRQGGRTYAVLVADIGQPAGAAQALQEWKGASLATLRGREVHAVRFHPSGAFDLADSQQVEAQGTRPDGSQVHSRAAYFAHGRHAFQAMVLGDELPPEAADPFFAGLRFE